ncbi:MAG: emp24p/erv25p- protein [Phylliscum demangeonii]|nr:MAG: emp24p/erv25p- protein [Phylliscum demangeonii]
MARGATTTTSWTTVQPLLLVLALVWLTAVPAVQCLHFYMDGNSPRCFYEELPKNTHVVGQYKGEEHNTNSQKYETHDGLNLFISVDEVFNNNHRVVSQRGSAQGRFMFTAVEAGEHKICFTPSTTSAAGWLSGGAGTAGVKLTLDLAIGDTSAIESTDKGKIQDIASKVRDLNERLQSIRREQVFQREREAEFRDQSESTNARVVRWTLVQLAVLGVTCAWQLSHLRAFFIKQKLT